MPTTPIAATDVTIPQGATLSYNTGGQTPTDIVIKNPTNISGLSLSLADIAISSVVLTSELKIPGKKSYGDVTVTATYIEAEFTGIQTIMNSRTPVTLKLVTSGTLAASPDVSTISIGGYFKGLTTPTVTDNNEPLSYEFVMMVNSVTIS